jgi:hypothetical protein
MDELFSAYLAEDKGGKLAIEGYLEILASKHLPSGLDSATQDLVPPGKELAAGPYTLGTVLYGGKPLYDFGLRENEWIQHVGVFGRTGCLASVGIGESLVFG